LFKYIFNEAALKRLILLMVCLGGCGASVPSSGTQFLPVPTGSAVYTGNLAKTATTTGSAIDQNSSTLVSYTEVQTVAGTITVNARFDTGTTTVSVSNPSIDFMRSSTDSSAPRYNFIEESSYSGTVSGMGSVSGVSFSGTLSGSFTQTSEDRSPKTGAVPEVFTGTVSGQVDGTNYTSATGTLNLSHTVSGQTVPFLSDFGFSATRN
jgi:hypothetical protein